MSVEQVSDHLARAIRRYLEVCGEHRQFVTTADPLKRRVEVRSKIWLPWIEYGGHAGRKSFCGPLPQAHAEAAIGLLKQLPLVERPVRSRDRFVDRCLLSDLAVEAGSGRSDEALIRLWVAAMMWGSGTSNGRGAWRTAQGLSSPRLASVLRETYEAVDADDLVGAHQRFNLYGTGESFFTKWFWSVSLNNASPRRRPLILDQRVRDVLDRILGQNDQWSQPGGALGYATFVDLAHSCARELGNGFEHVDAEKIEWLLFDRSNHDMVQEPCLAAWSI